MSITFDFTGRTVVALAAVATEFDGVIALETDVVVNNAGASCAIASSGSSPTPTGRRCSTSI